MKTYLLALLCCIYTVPSEADNRALTLLGMAEFSELRRPYYIGALYAEAAFTEPELALAGVGLRRMELRVVARRWSQRRFVSQWSQSFFINNSQAQLLKFDDELLQFHALTRDHFERGDRIIIESDTSGATTVTVNGVDQFRVVEPGFLELLLAKWIGPKPPTTEFKQAMLNAAVEPSLLAEYQALAPSPERIAQLAQQSKPSLSNTASAKLAPIPKLKQTPPKAAEVASAPTLLAAAEASTEILAESTDNAQVGIFTAELAQPELSDAEDELDAIQYAAQQEFLVSLYQNSVANHIRSYLQYPKRALQLRQEGAVRIRLSIDRDGNYRSQDLVQASKFRLLNEAALAAADDSGKAPAFPVLVDADVIEVEVPFVFGSATL